LTSLELGTRKLYEFLEANDAVKNFNRKQRIVLVASDFDEQTLSAVAWLNNNQVDIGCYRLIPYKLGGEIYLRIEKLLPVTPCNDFFVNLLDKSPATTAKKRNISRRTLPKINTLLAWGAVREGDIIAAKGREEEAVLLANGNVNVNGTEKSLQEWLKEVYDWSSVQTYAFAVHKESGKTLAQLREEYMMKEDGESS